MDMVDRVTYQFDHGDDPNLLPEKTRQAFRNLFDNKSDDAELVMRHLVAHCKWNNQTEYNDPVIEAKMNSLHGVIREVKKQLNMPPIMLVEQGEENE